MPINPQLVELLSVMPENLFVGDAATARATIDAGVGLMPVMTELARVEDRTIPGAAGELPVRVYRPSEESDLPVTVFFHGGGFVIGGLDSHDALARRIARHAECVVISVDYRLAPEFPFPAATEDAFAAYRWVREHAAELGGDPTRIALAGDSAGATLSATACLLAREHGVPQPVLQMLWYPGTGVEGTPSQVENAHAPLLGADSLTWFLGHYFGGRERAELGPYASIGTIEDLSGLAPAHVVVAGYDPLRDEGADYAERLRAAGNEVEFELFDDMVHGFMSFVDLVPRCAECATGSFASLHKALHP
ncbi:alpha/beta hydrolase [Embleya sp. NBC_00896]|uniref:alpha/beta hydrolase n=1 Tax=Embleya sp. NBC_00896 TaxID=2975961 RepID=UPI00386EE939|nr:alpha/beta hydrolase [Embleya sp. NBC_00896]